MVGKKNMHAGTKILEKIVLLVTQAPLWYHAWWQKTVLVHGTRKDTESDRQNKVSGSTVVTGDKNLTIDHLSNHL
jgi:hypothetical protein